ncbi:MAG: phospho-N-acetylmuramoyl-pentapeptide-transferase, partial [Clostridia bacterium]|nr:phospho-N-acetylmuramoyl-pentapeptide-transferase [Clostridia bacterium]
MEIKIIIAGILAVAIGLIIGYPVLLLMRKLKAGQQILSYVDAHKSKAGTPTMGGWMFILTIAIVGLIFFYKSTEAVIAICGMVAYGGIGFLDDFLKIKHHQNLGLKAYQKIIAQAGIAIILSVFCYLNGSFTREIIIPFTDLTFDIGWGIIPLVFMLYIATTNATNLLDGLDGLATSVSSVIFVTLAIMLMILGGKLAYSGNNLRSEDIYCLSGLALVTFGGLLAFLCYNGFPAKIFMGDTGSLALGGLMASIFAFSGQLLLILIIGIMLI